MPDTVISNFHTILGAGPVGLSVMDHLLAKQQRVRLISRSGRAQVPSSVEVLAGDITDLNFAREAIKGTDVVYNALNPPYHRWPELFPAIQHSVLEAAAATEAKLVVMDNLYMYGKTQGEPMTEDLPYMAHTRKGRVRARMATDLLDAHRAGKVRVAIGRASDFFGPRVRVSAVGEQIFQAALQGRAAQVFGDLDQPHTFTYIVDVGAALVLLAEEETALGQVWHIPNAETLTTRQFINQIFIQAGTNPQYQVVSKPMLRLLGLFNKSAGELVEMLYEFEEPFVVNHDKFSNVFYNLATPLSKAISATLKWFRVRS
ncbi:NAD-dependent epimerase/dehydratase family protein [Romeria aff. gracilis LEGE 07310]|uniref:NAD-dependent epimerase/dehydratase family protein n=1 Tax=Vasconcelosia minhoensis LEGE 07310 TaxID=915328 RepID=A0A8J7DMV1_9CYAN|nr:NAD-dependent epimerase/dehydratase family protein [Romeria gracilis]MBE9077330.1 NAD-dependent epimerase/dehydratase family protein [Romeria aff. gracilis LEGE 07310]